MCVTSPRDEHVLGSMGNLEATKVPVAGATGSQVSSAGITSPCGYPHDDEHLYDCCAGAFEKGELKNRSAFAAYRNMTIVPFRNLLGLLLEHARITSTSR